MTSDVGPLGTRDPLGSPARIGLLVILTLPLAALVFAIRGRGIDPDELEHLHAAWLVWQGDVPYRDFFEHHAPALYYLLIPLFSALGADLDVLWAARAMALVCSLASLWLASRMAQRLAGPSAGLIAACCLAWSTVFHLKGMELRPDVPALLLLLLAAQTLWNEHRNWRRPLVAGLLAGLATAFTQKSIVPAAGIWMGWLAGELADPSPSLANLPVRARIQTLLAGTGFWTLGGLLPWLAVAGAFATVQAADDLWHSAFQNLWIWPMRLSPVPQLRSIVAADLPLWLAASWEVARLLGECLQGKASHHRLRVTVAVSAAWCVVSLFWVKAAYPQYYLLWTPWLAILAARRFLVWLDGPVRGWTLLVMGSLGLLLAVHQLGMWLRAFVQGPYGALPHLVGISAPVTLSFACSLLMLFGAVVFSLANEARGRAVFFLIALAFFYGGLRIADSVLWTNDAQVERIAAIERLVPPDGQVLDGFSGYGVFRRHAWYYWWLNPYSKALIGEQRLVNELLPQLRQQPPSAVIVDEHIGHLPRPVVEWIQQEYQPTKWDPVWILKENGEILPVPKNSP